MELYIWFFYALYWTAASRELTGNEGKDKREATQTGDVGGSRLVPSDRNTDYDRRTDYEYDLGVTTKLDQVSWFWQLANEII